MNSIVDLFELELSLIYTAGKSDKIYPLLRPILAASLLTTSINKLTDGYVKEDWTNLFMGKHHIIIRNPQPSHNEASESALNSSSSEQNEDYYFN